MLEWSFTDLVISQSLILTVVFLALIKSSSSRMLHGRIYVRLNDILLFLIKVTSVIFIVSLTTSLAIGYRDIVFFIVFGVLVLLILIYISIGGIRGVRPFDNRLILFTSILLFLVEPLVLTFGNNFYPRWDWRSDSIYVTGSLSRHMEEMASSGLYYLVPVESLWTTILAAVTSPSHVIPAVVTTTYTLVILLSVYLLTRRLGDFRYGLVLFVILLLILTASPGDHIVFGRAVKPNPFLFLVFLYMLSRYNPSRVFIGLTLVSMLIIFQHGSTVLVLSILLVFELVLNIRSRRERYVYGEIVIDNRLIIASFILLTMSSFTYWLYAHIIHVTLGRVVGFIESIVNYIYHVVSGSTGDSRDWGYIPLYFRPVYRVYSYAWAFPIGISIAVLVNYVIDLFTGRRRLWGIKRHEVLGIIGLILTVSSYIAYVTNERGQYYIPVAYFFLHISSAFAIAEILAEKKPILRIICLSIFSLFVVIGSHTPSHAILEHPDFESAAMIFRSTRYIESSFIAPLIPGEATVFYDYDLPVKAGIYKDIREAIYGIVSGVDPWRFYTWPYTIVAIKNTRETYPLLRDLDTIYASTHYTVFIIEK